MNKTHTIRLIWSTPSGTGSTELSFACKDYNEALALGRAYFKQYFSGYTLTGTSIV